MLHVLVFEIASRLILLYASLRSFESLSKWLQDDDEREFGEAAKQWITFWGVRFFFFVQKNTLHTQQMITGICSVPHDHSIYGSHGHIFAFLYVFFFSFVRSEYTTPRRENR